MFGLARSLGQDSVAALAVIALGAYGTVESLGYPLGGLRNIGPGAFPLIVSVLLVLSGALILAEGVAALGRERDAPPELAAFRVMIFIVAGLLAFALLIPRFGLAPAIAACVALSALADGNLKAWQVAVLAATIACFCAVVFVVLLNLPLDLVTW